MWVSFGQDVAVTVAVEQVLLREARGERKSTHLIIVFRENPLSLLILKNNNCRRFNYFFREIAFGLTRYFPGPGCSVRPCSSCFDWVGHRPRVPGWWCSSAWCPGYHCYHCYHRRRPTRTKKTCLLAEKSEDLRNVRILCFC